MQGSLTNASEIGVLYLCYGRQHQPSQGQHVRIDVADGRLRKEELDDDEAVRAPEGAICMKSWRAWIRMTLQ